MRHVCTSSLVARATPSQGRSRNRLATTGSSSTVVLALGSHLPLDRDRSGGRAGQPSPLVVIEQDPLAALHLLQDAVLLLQVCDHVILMSIHPTDEEQEEKLEREREVHAAQLRRAAFALRAL